METISKVEKEIAIRIVFVGMAKSTVCIKPVNPIRGSPIKSLRRNETDTAQIEPEKKAFYWKFSSFLKRTLLDEV